METREGPTPNSDLDWPKENTQTIAEFEVCVDERMGSSLLDKIVLSVENKLKSLDLRSNDVILKYIAFLICMR